MTLVDQWGSIESELPAEWADARLRLTIPDEGNCDRAAALLGPANPFRRGKLLRFAAVRSTAGSGPEQIRRLLQRLDAERIDGELELVSTEGRETSGAPARATLEETWTAALETLPHDWSDVFGEVELRSTDNLDRAALMLSPLNPTRFDGTPSFRFRCARTFGYGASAGMVRRCLARCDEQNIRGTVRIIRALSDTHPVGTQGPVWYVGGKAV